MSKSTNQYLRFVCTGPAPNNGQNFSLKEIKLPRIIDSSFAVKPFERKVLGTHNGGITWAEMADQ